MNQQQFNHGFDAPTYVEKLRNYRSFVRKLMEEAQANTDHVARLRSGLESYRNPVRATLMTEDWCGDSACNIPVLHDLLSQAGVELRILRGSEHPDLEKGYNDEGTDHIPVVSFWDAEWNEITRWVEAPAAVAEKKSAWEQEHPEFAELYQKQDEDREAAKQFGRLYRQLLEEMADWYRNGMWDETTREIVESLE
jgi:hypothetical protein